MWLRHIIAFILLYACAIYSNIALNFTLCYLPAMEVLPINSYILNYTNTLTKTYTFVLCSSDAFDAARAHAVGLADYFRWSFRF